MVPAGWVSRPRSPRWSSSCAPTGWRRTPSITLPHLAVILTAEASLIRARLRARGAHHRFVLDPDDVQRELDLYEEAITVLHVLKVPVLRLDIDDLRPEEVAGEICRIAAGLFAIVALAPSPSSPDSHP